METVDPKSNHFPTETGRVQVVVRVRPTINIEDGVNVATRRLDERRVEVITDVSAPDNSLGKEDKAKVVGKGKVYEFDACVGAEGAQQAMYEATQMDQLVEQALDGYNCTIFAYGQTGSGKTFTVVGPRYFKEGGAAPREVDDDDGLLPRAYRAVFASVERRIKETPGTSYKLHLSCVEIYNEAVTDLFGPAPSPSSVASSKSLSVRHDKAKGFYVDGLTQKTATDLSQTLALVYSALVRRHVGSHRLNTLSTRSHLIVTLNVEVEDAQQPTESKPPLALDASSSRRPSHSSSSDSALPDEGPGRPRRRYGKLVLVDLAGSERLKETGQSDDTALRETSNINRSLFALGKVLSALSHRGKGPAAEGASFVPYRDSKLTQLLYDGLKGTGRVLMVACCSPTRAAVDETLNTLHFAQVALHIKSEPVVQLDPHDQLIIDLKSTILSLKAENRKLARVVKEMADGKDFQEALIELEGGAGLSGTLKNVLGVTGAEGSTSPTSRSLLHRPKSMPSPDKYAPYGLTGVAKPGVRRTRNARQTLNMPVRGPGEASSSGALPPLRPRGNLPKTDKLQNLKKISQQAWKLKAKASPAPALTYDNSAGDLPPIEDFPELVALEAQFQHRLAQARGLTDGDSDSQVNTSLEGVPPPSVQSEPGASHVVPARLPKELSTITESQSGSPVRSPGRKGKSGAVAEPKAIRWAEKNRWFGTDVPMTSYAYEVHDQLVEAEGIDPNSDAYYDELDRRMALRFPEQLGSAAQAAQARVHAVALTHALKAYTKGGAASVASRPRGASSQPYISPLAGDRQPRQAWNAKLRNVASEAPLRRDSAGPSKALNSRLGWNNTNTNDSWSSGRDGVYVSSFSGQGAYMGGGTFGARPSGGAGTATDRVRERVAVMQELRAQRDEAEAERKRLMAQLGRRLHKVQTGGGSSRASAPVTDATLDKAVAMMWNDSPLPKNGRQSEVNTRFGFVKKLLGAKAGVGKTLTFTGNQSDSGKANKSKSEAGSVLDPSPLDGPFPRLDRPQRAIKALPPMHPFASPAPQKGKGRTSFDTMPHAPCAIGEKGTAKTRASFDAVVSSRVPADADAAARSRRSLDYPPRRAVSPIPEASTANSRLAWSGEPPKRFVVLQGSKIVFERELFTIFTIFYESKAIGDGVFTLDALRVYVSRKTNLPSGEAKTLSALADVIRGALATRASQLALKGEHLSLQDVLQVLYPRVSAEEIQFLLNAESQIMTRQIPGKALADGTEVPTHTLDPVELRMVTDIYQRFAKNDMGLVDVSELHKKVLTICDIEESEVNKQLGFAGLPKRQRAFDLEVYIRFMCFNLASTAPINLDHLLSSLLGFEIALGKAVRALNGESTKVQDIRAELQTLAAGSSPFSEAGPSGTTATATSGKGSANGTSSALKSTPSLREIEDALINKLKSQGLLESRSKNSIGLGAEMLR